MLGSVKPPDSSSETPDVMTRLFMPADSPALYAIERVCFAPPLRFSRTLMRSLSEDPNCRTWIGIVNDVCAGFAMVGVAGEFDEAAGVSGSAAYLWTIEVLPVFRRKGVARELLLRVEESAREARCAAIELHMAARNLEALALYEGFGFVRYGIEREFYGRGMDAFRYRKIL
jgi:ribosomal protein S18 acetylase RimI-like enzyme